MGFPDSSVGKESICNAGDPGLVPGLGRSPGEGIGYPLRYSWASLVAQMVKNPPTMWETWVPSLSWDDPLEEGIATHSNILAWRIPWIEEPGGLYSPWGCRVAQNETNTETIDQLRPLVVSYNHYQSLCDKRHTLLTLSHQGHI